MAALDPDGANTNTPVEPPEPGDDRPTPPTTRNLWSLLHDDTAWHDWPEPHDP